MKNLFIILLAFIGIPALAQSQYTPDTEAKSILDKTAQALQKTTGAQAAFTLTIENNQTNEKQTLSGALWLKGNKFKLVADDIETYYNGKTQWVYMVDEDEVTVSTPTADELQDINPTLIISSYKTGYKLKKDSDATVDGKAAFVVCIYPDDRTKPYHRIEILIEKSSYNILSINTYGKNGTNTLIKIKKYERDVSLADSLFAFDEKKYPNAEVIDLR